MGDDVVSEYLQRKLSSNLAEAEADPNSPSRIISRFRSLEKQIYTGSAHPIKIDVLYDVMGALSECRVFSYERPTAKAAVSKKSIFYFIRLLYHPLSEVLFIRKMKKRLKDIEDVLAKLNPPAPVVDQEIETTPISDIMGFKEQVIQIENWLIPSSSDTFTEIAIVGKWGCGKTALAGKVFASPTIKKEFWPIWVCLSDLMPEKEQAGEIVVKYIQEKIGQDKWDELKRKRYLMVLDNASWHWPGGLNLDLPKERGGALIVTTRREVDLGDTRVIRLEPQLSDDICWHIFTKAVAEVIPTEPRLSSIRDDVMRNSGRRALAVKTLGTMIPKLLQRNHWIRARDLIICWAETSRYWKWRKEGTEEVAELVDVCWLDITGKLELKMFLLNRKYSAYLVYKLKEWRESLDVPMEGSVMILGKHETKGEIYIDGDHPGRVPWAEAEAGTGWMEIKLGEFFNAGGDGEKVEAKLHATDETMWKSGLIVKGISFRLN